jgi:hypothetical protein
MVAVAVAWQVQLSSLDWVVVKVEVSGPRDAGFAHAIVNLSLTASTVKAINVFVFSAVVKLPLGVANEAVSGLVIHRCPFCRCYKNQSR